ncbi:lignin-forming anionic peroxidase-like [Andrographis paniculata]|uniref:lignin-forming anionic peroxidase-like n=1 Tax=Andrographis paniculata TaxID=175694 RepID=UPI0021E97A70|nr:lignin-forming anionic peroxidase-like [Andrographis paniculata]
MAMAMAMAASSLTMAALVVVLLLPPSAAQLSATFYDSSCPNAAATVRASIRQAVSRERRVAASLIRLHFHDCFAQGCDASILLDQTDSIQTEKTVLPNRSLRPQAFAAVDAAKAAVEQACPGVVSCADILTLAARDAAVAVGAPTWNVRLGRRDSTGTNPTEANADIPLGNSNLDRLISSFARKQLSVRDMVALSGAHTLGQAQCFTFRNRIYSNRTDIDAGFAATRRRQCPQSGGDSNLAPLDLVTPNSFDNNYYRNLVQRRGLLNSDQALFNGSSTDAIVTEYSRNPQAFASDFGNAMIRMSEISPLVGNGNGIIRRVCTAIN